MVLPAPFKHSMAKAAECVIVLDDIKVPTVVREMFGLGPKFVFPNSVDPMKPDLIGFMASVRTVADAVPNHGVTKRIVRGMKKVIEEVSTNAEDAGAQKLIPSPNEAAKQYLCRGFHQARRFLAQHPDVSVTESDKGHKTKGAQN